MPSGKPLYNSDKSINDDVVDLYSKLKGVAHSFAPWAINGFKIVDNKTFESRIEICKSCEFWDQSGFGGTGKCQKCGCSIQAKLRMDTSKCPIDKWGPEKNKEYSELR